MTKEYFYEARAGLKFTNKNNRKNDWIKKNKSKGFSLIELVMTIVIIGVALAALTNSLFSGVGRNADLLWQAKATHLAQAYLDEILAMRYQEDSPLGGGAVNGCAEEGPEADEAGNRSLFDDVDDYHGLNESADFLDTAATSTYAGYTASIAVTCKDHLNANSNTSKLIAITITSPTKQNLVFSALRADL